MYIRCEGRVELCMCVCICEIKGLIGGKKVYRGKIYITGIHTRRVRVKRVEESMLFL